MVVVVRLVRTCGTGPDSLTREYLAMNYSDFPPDPPVTSGFIDMLRFVILCAPSPRYTGAFTCTGLPKCTSVIEIHRHSVNTHDGLDTQLYFAAQEYPNLHTKFNIDEHT